MKEKEAEFVLQVTIIAEFLITISNFFSHSGLMRKIQCKKIKIIKHYVVNRFHNIFNSFSMFMRIFTFKSCSHGQPNEDGKDDTCH